ncbi:hypothetical protein PIROE2DRAFT_1666 [Piromyces sp. E2]|nr:hypothetical protein PIROE2DRAFT_1666 [Piromyces sp. E2]|eukprot:OUM70251.1 hypothetical protein PIROE2DRAFT_1666 [Piromyces sp. E2]
MTYKHKSFLEPIADKKKKKDIPPPCFTNRLDELNTIKTLPQYIPNTRTPTLRPIPKINSRYKARLSDTKEFEKEILDSEANKEFENDIRSERNLLKLKFDPEVVSERSSIPFGIMPKSKLLTPVMKRNDSGILNSFLSENSLLKNGNLDVVQKTYNFGITPDIFEYLRQHSKSVTKPEYYHYLSEPPSLGNIQNDNYPIIDKYNFPFITSISTQQLGDINSYNLNRLILKPIQFTSNDTAPTLENTKSNNENTKINESVYNDTNNTIINEIINNNANNNSNNNINITNNNYNIVYDKNNLKNDKGNTFNTNSIITNINTNNDKLIDNDVNNKTNDDNTNMLEDNGYDEYLNDTFKNKQMIESYIEYIKKTSKELTDIHRLTHFNGINGSEAYKKSDNTISNSTYKYICNVVQNKNEESKNNGPLKLNKKKTTKSLLHSNSHDSEVGSNYWINSIMNGFKDEQLIQDLTHTERIDSKKPIYRQRFPANIKQMHIDVRKKTDEEKRLKYEKLIKDVNNNSATKSNNSLNSDSSHNTKNIPNNNNPNNYMNENIYRKKLFRTKHNYLMISLLHFSSLLKSEPSRQISTYSFEKNEFIQEEDIIPLNLFLKTSLSNYQGPIPKPNTQMFYQMYGIFIQGLKSQDKEVRFESMNGIAKLDCIEMIPSCEKIWFNSLLNQVITEGNSDDRWNICTMLCRHGMQTSPVIDYLESILGDTDTSKRKYVIYLLSRISEKNINSFVKDIIYNKIKDANWRVRLDCIRILQKLLRRMLKYIPENDLYIDIDKEDIQKCDENSSVLKNSKSKDGNEKDILEKDSYLVNQALQIVMNIMWYDWKLDVRNAASRLLMRIGKGRPIYSWIIQMISSDSPMKKINGLKCIGFLNVMTSDAIDPFLKCFDDVFSSVRIEACKVAYILELNYPPLIQKLANCFDDNSWEVRAFAIKAMPRCRCKSDLINDTILWNLVHETNHRVLYETIKAVKKLNLVNTDNKIKEALLLLSEDKNESIAESARRILYDNGILFEKNKDIDFTSPEDVNKEQSQKEINILYNTRPPFNFACDGLDMIKHEVNLLTMKDFITSEIIEQEKKCKNYNRNEEMKKYNLMGFNNIHSYRQPDFNQIHNRRSHRQSNNNKNINYKIRIIDDMTFNYIEKSDE